MGRGTVEHMLKVAEKKKPLNDILVSILELTDEDIDAIVTQPSWIRKCLKSHRENLIRDSRMASMNIPDVAIEQHEEYPVMQFKGTSDYVIDNGWESSACLGLTVEPNDLLMILGMGKIKVNSTVVNASPSEQKFLLKKSESLDNMSITAYNKHLQNVLERKYGGSSQEDGRDTDYGWTSAIRIDK
jgi:hypothetical protein